MIFDLSSLHEGNLKWICFALFNMFHVGSKGGFCSAALLQIECH